MIKDVIHTDKILGKGMNGTVYMVRDKMKNKYAMKIQQILPKDMKKDSSSLMWREIDFAVNMASKYPDHFMQLYDHTFDEKCNYQHSFEGFDFKIKDLPKKQQTYYKKLSASPYCSLKLWSYVDTTLHNLLNSWKQFDTMIYQDLLIQILYIVYLLDREGYQHNDLHQKNIGLKKTTRRYILIFNKKVPTHGYLVQAIDFELNLHKKYKLKAWERYKLTNNNDMFTIVNLALFDFADLRHFYKKGKIDEYHLVNIAKEDAEILGSFLDKIQLTKENRHFLMNTLYKIMFYEKYERQLLGSKFTKAIPPKLYVPLDRILYIVQNIYDPAKIIKYMIMNR